MKNEIEALILEDQIEVKNESHLRCMSLFYPFMNAYSENPHTIKSFFKSYLNEPITTQFRVTACFNGRFDNGCQVAPFNVHLYVQFDDIRLNLYCIQNETDLKDALSYKECLPSEYKVLVVEACLLESLSIEGLDSTIVIPIHEIEKYL